MAKRKAPYAWVKLNTETVSMQMEGAPFSCIRQMFMCLPVENLDLALTRLREDAEKMKNNAAKVADGSTTQGENNAR